MATSTASPLREWRESVGIPLNTLARTCGVSWWVLARVEAGQVEPRAALVARLAEVTGLAFDRLLGARGRARLERFRAAADDRPRRPKGGRPSKRAEASVVTIARPDAAELERFIASVEERRRR
jgi:transcriptional regulator with XRE-family HTH domain